MVMSNPTADWERVGDSFYRKVQLYSSIFDDELELENYAVAAAPYGGALALHRKEDSLQVLTGNQVAKSSIDIYSCAGKLVRQIKWDKGSIRGLGWSEDEQLLVVTTEGTVRCYYDLHGDFTQFSLGNGAEDAGVRACRFWSTGFVALLFNNRLVAVSRYAEPRPRLLATPPEGPIHSWALIPPSYTLSRSVEVLLAIEQTIYVVDPSESDDRMLQNGPFTQMAVSPHGRYVTVYTKDGKLWIITSDFQDKISEYDSRATTPPRDVQWCGNGGVLLAWEDEVHLIGLRSGDAVAKYDPDDDRPGARYFYDGYVHLLPDIDGTRIISNSVCDFVQPVPDAVQEVFELGSTSPASVLLDAVHQLEQKSPKADDNIQLIRPRLAEAVDTCIRAAGYEFNVHWQKQLMKAASFGKSVLDLYNSDDFVEMCETLRVLNAVRYYETGLPISYDQYQRLTAEKLVQRLLSRQDYRLALRLSEYLRLPGQGIYVHWACQKVRRSSEDEDGICRAIVGKLQGQPGVSFEAIARVAYDEGRGRLATALLNFEPRAGKQVPLLLRMEEDEVALDKAIDSGDTDLMYIVLLHLRHKLPLAAFFRVIGTRAVATALVASSARAHDRELLKDLYYQDDRRLDGANVLVREALDSDTLSARLDKLALAQRVLQDSKAHGLESKALDDASKLLRLQDALDKEIPTGGTGGGDPSASRHPGVGFLGLSLHDTIYHLIRLGHGSRARKMQTDFRVPDKAAIWLRLRALVARRDWAALDDWTRTGFRANKPPAIGWPPFVAAVLAAGNAKLAASFIPRCTGLSPSERVDWWLRCGCWLPAAEEALKARDGQPLLQTVKAKAAAGAAPGTGPAVVAEIERLVVRAGKRG
ncbi:MAG: hypothetical protein M1826_004730 [Phylliscum demangeonii]|nr:MAG: hypothetical protein M1826_004730 [Phylliscum demangeonii]